MKLSTAAHCLLGLALLAPAFAEAADLTAINNSTSVMLACAGVANEIAAMKVPPDHAAARQAAGINAMITNKAAQLKVDAQHTAFMQQIAAENNKLGQCGAAYQDALKKSAPVIDVMRKTKLTQQEAPAAGDAMKRYADARDKLMAAVKNLSNDIQIQSYVHQTLLTYYLK